MRAQREFMAAGHISPALWIALAEIRLL